MTHSACPYFLRLDAPFPMAVRADALSEANLDSREARPALILG